MGEFAAIYCTMAVRHATKAELVEEHMEQLTEVQAANAELKKQARSASERSRAQGPDAHAITH
eukprot:6212229-Pleurochrysis_carterae.AAC.3